MAGSHAKGLIKKPKSPVDSPARSETAPSAASTVSTPEQGISLTDANLASADRCLAAGCFSLSFDIGEIWTFVPDPTKQPEKVGGKLVQPLVPSCLHVYAQPATVETYSAKIVGLWNRGSRDQIHTLSPSLCTRAHNNSVPLWFTSEDRDTPLHADLPLNTAVALPIRIDSLKKACVVIFFSTQDVRRQRAALEFLQSVAKAAVLACTKGFLAAFGSNEPLEDEVQEGELNSVAVKLHPGGQINTRVDWSEVKDVEFLVNGSRCTIYTAFYRDTPVVIKLLRKDVPDAALVRKELHSEMDLLLRVDHQNIVRLIGAGFEPECFLLIERLDGGTLAQRCGSGIGVRDRRSRFKRKQPFSYVDLLRTGRQLAEALRYLHEEAIPGRMLLHRDLKPDNVGFDAHGNVKLLDLGLSKAVPRSEMDNATYQMTGETGSTRYMAPEVAESRPYNEKSDVYSYSMVLWEMATLRKPYEGMERDEFYAQVVRGSVRPGLNKKWPKEFCDLLQACWDEDYNKRPRFADICAKLQEMGQEAINQTSKLNHPRRGSLLARLGLTSQNSAWF